MSRNDDPAQDHPPITRTEADTTSDTRFGPRPVPEGHRHPAGPMESRRIPPHGDVSPDGSRVWPRPSPTAKWLVWGGTALAAAAATAGTVIVARHVIDALSGGGRGKGGPEHSMAPRFADLSPEERAAMRRRVRERDAEDERRMAGLRARAEASASHDPAARPRRAPPMGFAQEVEANAASLRNGFDDLMHWTTGALSGFRGVAGQASTILREFDGAAGIIGDILCRKGADRAEADRKARPHDTASHDAPPHDAPMPDLRDDPLLHDPLDGPDAEGPSDQNARLHRL